MIVPPFSWLTRVRQFEATSAGRTILQADNPTYPDIMPAADTKLLRVARYRTAAVAAPFRPALGQHGLLETLGRLTGAHTHKATLTIEFEIDHWIALAKVAKRISYADDFVGNIAGAIAECVEVSDWLDQEANRPEVLDANWSMASPAKVVSFAVLVCKIGSRLRNGAAFLLLLPPKKGYRMLPKRSAGLLRAYQWTLLAGTVFLLRR